MLRKIHKNVLYYFLLPARRVAPQVNRKDAGEVQGGGGCKRSVRPLPTTTTTTTTTTTQQLTFRIPPPHSSLVGRAELRWLFCQILFFSSLRCFFSVIFF